MGRNKGVWVMPVLLMATIQLVQGGELIIKSFDRLGRLSYDTIDDGTNHNYRVEWAPDLAGPWSEFGISGAYWLNAKPQPCGVTVTSAVPVYYRVVAIPGDYLVVDLSGGSDAATYPVSYYRTIAEIPDGADSDVYRTTKLLLRLVPRGSFMVGSPTNELGRYSYSNDYTQHVVTVTQSFYIGVFELTQQQWLRVMGTWPSFFGNPSYRDSRPVERVSYSMIRGESAGADWPASSDVDAESFMGRLRSRTGQEFDLPTELQWEYAARAGTTTALNSGYNITNTIRDGHLALVGRYFHNGGSGGTDSSVNTSVGTARVGSYLPNAWGLYDMHGNVWETCRDWFPEYEGLSRVCRGGGFTITAYGCRVAFRATVDPSYVGSEAGFRVVVPAEP